MVAPKTLTITLVDCSEANGGDLMYDNILKEFFILNPDQTKEIRQRNLQYSKVQHAGVEAINKHIASIYRSFDGLYPVNLFLRLEDQTPK